jgi:predicted nuclease of predicted toxin-antitoxin system
LPGPVVKLLFDQNLSFRLVEAVEDLFPDSSQVRLLGLDQATDREIWSYAGKHGFVIVTKDSDFHEYCQLYGSPPKVIWIKFGNASTATVEARLRKHAKEVQETLDQPGVHFVELR